MWRIECARAAVFYITSSYSLGLLQKGRRECRVNIVGLLSVWVIASTHAKAIAAIEESRMVAACDMRQKKRNN